MAGTRLIVQDQGGLNRPLQLGDIEIIPGAPLTVSADANYTMTVNDLARGYINFSNFTAGRNITVPTAAAIIAAVPNMNVGDSVQVEIGITAAFAGTMVTATGITLKGKAAVPASGRAVVLFTKTSGTTMDCCLV